MTPIVEHVVKDNVAEATKLLDGGVSAQALFPAALLAKDKLQPQPGEWPLAVFAARHGALATLKLLFERGATIPTEQLASSLEALAGKAGSEVLLWAFLGTLDVDVTANAAALSRAFVASFVASNRPVLDALIDAGASPAARDDEGRPVLATALGNLAGRRQRLGTLRLAMLDLLIEKGAPVDAADSEGKLPLAHALAMGSFEGALKLLKAGSPGVGRLTPAMTARLEAAVVQARTVKTTKGEASVDLSMLCALQGWDALLELGEAGMRLDVTSSDQLNSVWDRIRERAPHHVQLRAIPLIDDRDP